MKAKSSLSLLFIIFSVTGKVKSDDDYQVTLETDGPIVKGANITIIARLYYQDDVAKGTFIYSWEDNGIPQHSREVTSEEGTDTWIIYYNQKLYPKGPYTVQVDVKKPFFIRPYTIASNRITFEITETLNGKLKLLQKNKTREDVYISSKDPLDLTVDLKETDAEYIKLAPRVLTYWFIDCIYYGFTNNLSFAFNFPEPGKHHHLEALVMADFTPLPPPTTTTVAPSTTTTTTIKPSTTSTTTTRPTNATAVPTSSTVHPPANLTAVIPISTTLHPLVNSTASSVSFSTTKGSVQPDTAISSPAPSASPLLDSSATRSPKTKRDVFGHNLIANQTEKIQMIINGTTQAYDGRDGDFPFICNGNGAQVAVDDNHIYGHFSRSIKVRAPISNVNVTGNNWLQHGNMLSLSVRCQGSKEYKYCVRYKAGAYNVTGNETCSYYEELDTCYFIIQRYFIEPTTHTVLIIIKNEVSEVVTPVTITVYKVQKQAQLSVIVVPVASCIFAIILIIFGVAYYIQNRSRYLVEVADFNFGQQYDNELEYKTFRERLRDSIANAFTRAPSPTNSEAPTWPPGGRKYGSMT